ncbi:hypothetical protein A5821_003375 [Enterococcus sp. 7F3_DIV0205]|uniref:Uncharacterized protein n=1 Tax=Candidatus Enterococcus palustris TaxID=1834189 RepID=A0AAQ3Y7J2_9ENTE|nr:hypothetical protein [Enterococcus sp. 7F3_DIV0205]OTN84257.1 hypothetical protein A5821_000183 [Enterococcus sp. 7F3_DIV0205]
MGKLTRILLEADFNYFRYSAVKMTVIVFFLVSYFMLIIITANRVLDTEYEPFEFVISFIISWFVFSYLFETLYKKLFSNKGRILSGQGFIKLWINKEEILINKGQITNIKAQVSSHRSRYGGRSTSTKLIIYTMMGKFHLRMIKQFMR